MRHLDLFSGIGGFALAAQANGHETVCFVEIDKFCQKVLAKNFPGVPIVEDVHDIEAIKRVIADAAVRGIRRGEPSGETGLSAQPTQDSLSHGCRIGADGKDGAGVREQRNAGTGDGNGLLVTAGFPCQPFSHAGRRQGANDDRYLWPATLAVITATRPEWVLLENVPGILSMVFPDSGVRVGGQASLFQGEDEGIYDYDTIIGGIDRDLRQAGYSPVYMVIPACGLGAPHRRDRVWIVANRDSGRCKQRDAQIGAVPEPHAQHSDATNPSDDGFDRHGAPRGMAGELTTHQEQPGYRRPGRGAGCGRLPDWREDWYSVALRTCVRGIPHGTPRKLDRHRVSRLKALGNAIVWPIAAEIMRGML